MISLLLGPDRLLARQTAAGIATKHDPDGANTTWIDGRESSLDQIVAAVATVSFFGAPPVVIVSDLLARQAKDLDEGEANPDPTRKSNASAITRLIAAVPEEHCLVLLEPGLMSVPAAFKAATSGVTIVTNEPPRGAALVKWIAEAAACAHARIDRRAAQVLAERLYPQTWDRKPGNPRFDRPPDLAVLTAEIAKLALAAHPDAISVETIQALTPGGPDQRVFRFLDAALAGDLRTALLELERLEAAGEEPAMLLAQLLGQVELAAVTAAADGQDANAIARNLGSIAPARVAAVTASSRRLPHHHGAPVAAGVSVDRKLKTGRTRRPIDALHEALLALATSG